MAHIWHLSKKDREISPWIEFCEELIDTAYSFENSFDLLIVSL